MNPEPWRGGGRVAALLNAHDAQALELRLSGSCEFRACHSSQELADVLRSAPHDLVVSDVRDPFGIELAQVLRPSSGGPACPVILWSSLAREDVRATLDIVRTLRSVDVALVGFDDLAAVVLRALARQNAAAEARAAMLRCVDGEGHGHAGALVVASVALGLRRPTMDELSRACNASARTMRRNAAAAGLPAPHRLIAASCCAQVTWLLGVARWAAARVATAAGFGGVQALSHFVQRHAGQPPQALVRDKGFAGLLATWAGLVNARE